MKRRRMKMRRDGYEIAMLEGAVLPEMEAVKALGRPQ